MPTDLLAISYALDTIADAAQKFGEVMAGHRVFAFRGDMGAGKTTFIHHLCDHLGVTDAVSSPTFALINEYHFSAGGVDNTIFHMDWYRLRDSEEAFNAGMEDCLEQARAGKAYCFIEWPEKAEALLRIPHVEVSIDILSDTERRMNVRITP